MLTLLTTTGARPAAFALCNLWMQRQDYRGKVRWIIVDDGQQPTPIERVEGWFIQVVRPQPYWQFPQNTQARNLRAGLDEVRADDRLVIIEDDDHYKPGWLSRVAHELRYAELVGQGLSRKYSVGNMRAKEEIRTDRASLCASAMKGSALHEFRSVARDGARLMDLVLWRRCAGRVFAGDDVTSIKRLPGRKGIDSGHQPRFGEIADPDGALLRAWIGDDADYYRGFFNRGTTPGNKDFNRRARRIAEIRNRRLSGSL